MNRFGFSLFALLGALMPLVFDSALKGAALLAVAALCALALGRASAATRHLVWLVAVVALLVVPVLSAALPQWRILPKWARVPEKTEPIADNGFHATDGTHETNQSRSPHESHPGPLAARTDTEPVPSEPFYVASNLAGAVSAPPRPWHDWLAPAWAAGFTLLLLRLLFAHLLLRRAAHGCTVATAAFSAQLQAASAQLGLRQRITLLLDEKRTIPVVWGVFRPRLLLPAEAREWGEGQLRSVLLHELAHIRRRDPLGQWLTQIACALHWWNPLVWLAAWRLHVERERACDDLVLASGVRPSTYAGHLLDVATRLSPAMARKSSLEGRLLAVLSEKLNRRSVTTALAAIALIFGAGIAIPVAMLRAADEKWNPPHAAHIGGNEFSAFCVHDGKDAAFVIAYHGDFSSSASLDSNPKTRTWTNSGTLTAKKSGIALSFHRMHTAPDKLGITTAPAEGRDLGKPAPPPRKFGQKEYDLTKGRVFPLTDSGAVRQLDIATPVVTDQQSAKKLAALIAAIAPQERAADPDKPKDAASKVLLESWKTSARNDGKIPGGCIGEMAASLKTYMDLNAGTEAATKCEAVFKKCDATHDWTPADAAALLDEIEAVAPSRAEWAMRTNIERTIHTGKPLPDELKDVPWGQPAANGLRIAWLLEPRAETHPLDSVLKSRVLFHNAGIAPVCFATEDWIQTGGHKAKDANGKDIGTWAVDRMGVRTRMVFRLTPGEYAEVAGHGIGVGSHETSSEKSIYQVVCWIEAKEGDVVTFSPGKVLVSFQTWQNNEGRKDSETVWNEMIAARVAQEGPVPATVADRELLLKRVTQDLGIAAPYYSSRIDFVHDNSPGSLATLTAKLQAAGKPMHFAGELSGGETKFRVTAAGSPPETTEEEAFTAWGEELSGLQAGVGFLPGGKRAYSHGETVRLAIRVRNVGTKEVKFQYLRQFFAENPPAVTDGEGRPVPLEGFPTAFGIHIPREVKLAPGKEIELYELNLRPRPASEAGVAPSQKEGAEALVQRIWATGKVSVQYQRVFRNSSSEQLRLDPALSELATGKLELEIKPDAPVQQQVPLSTDSAKIDRAMLEGNWEGEKDGANVKVQFQWLSEHQQVRWDVKQPGSSIAAQMSVVIEPDGSAAKLIFRKGLEFEATQGRLTPGEDGTLVLEIIPNPNKSDRGPGYPAVKGLVLKRVPDAVGEKPKGADARITPESLLAFWRGTVNGEAISISFHRPPVDADVQCDIYFGEATIGAPTAFRIAPDGTSVTLTSRGKEGGEYGKLTPGKAGTLRLELTGRQQGQTEAILTRDADERSDEPQQEEPRTLFGEWKKSAYADAKIPGELIGKLAKEVRKYAEANPNLFSGQQLPKLLPRFDASRNWTPAEAVKLLDDVAYYSTGPIEAVLAEPSDALWKAKTRFEIIPVKIAEWSPEKNGLRIGMRVVEGEWSVGGKVRVELWVHNAGAKDVSFKANPGRADVGLMVAAEDTEGGHHGAANGNVLLLAIPTRCTLPAGFVAKVKDFELSFDAPGTKDLAWVQPKFRD
ncbi:MAG: M56 family metallopeptidase, partial [Chthoniobacteraceae bacterium]